MRLPSLTSVLAAIAAAAAIVAAGAALLVVSGVYNVAANSQHTQPVYSILEFAMRRSVVLRARFVELPGPDLIAPVGRGAACYEQRCQDCHGGPGVGQKDFALGMQPLPGPLMNAPQRWTARELYSITRNGITMSGMPAWEFRLSDADLWGIVSFLELLPQLSPVDYKTLLARHAGEKCGSPDAELAVAAMVDATRGRIALSQYACTGCHQIPGITGGEVHVGPPLAGFARRKLIAGSIVNTQEHVIRWLMDPKSIRAETAMPKLGVTERDARDMAAYLGTLM